MRSFGALIGTLCFFLLSIQIGNAGGGPENVFLLVNSASDDSIAVANHYIKLRKIPENNVFRIEYRKNKAFASSEVFREQILFPTLSEIKKRNLTQQIDYIVYSCDFPWRISFLKDFPDEKFPPQLKPMASLTGATYLSAFVLQKRKELVGLNSNFYFTPANGNITTSQGFRSQYLWNPGGKRTAGNGLRYFLSCMLGVTNGRGNTVEEIFDYLNASAAVDGTKPKGTIYFLENTGVRSKTRHNGYDAAIREIRMAGVGAEKVTGKFLTRKNNVLGLTSGQKQLEVNNSGCNFLPGAFCDNLTSLGGVFTIPKKPPGHTCVSDFLREGAAGASGTIAEPFAIPQKFPAPVIHVHYVHGCSMAEAFYQSVQGPYQQILVGDPLCQPWANVPKVLVSGVIDGEKVAGKVEITAAAQGAGSRGIKSYELFVDGRRIQQKMGIGKFLLDTTTMQDGAHELRVVAVENSPIESQGRWIGSIAVANGD